MRFYHSLLLPLFLLLAALPARAILTVQVAAVDAKNSSNFLLAAEAANVDPAYDRESVNARFQMQLFNPNGVFADEIEVEATFSLLNQATGLPVDLASGGTSIIETQLFNLGAQQQEIEAIDAALEPASMLDPAVNHRVVASVRYRAHSGAWSAPVVYQGTWRKWVHFMNATADDDSLNVKAVASPLVVTDAQILKSVAGQEQFVATLGMTLHRYDIESTPQPAADVPVKIDLRLYDSMSLDEVALATPSLTVLRPMLGRSAANPPDPMTDVWTQELSFAPAPGAVVNPTAEYVLEVTVSTLEPDNTPVPSLPPLQAASARRFLVLSGKLSFGGVETIFTQLANDPSVSMALTPPDEFATQLAVTEGSAPAAPGRRYGNGDLLSVSYDPMSGDATVTGGTQSLETTASDIVTLGGLRFIRGVIRMDSSGALLENGGVLFPAGFGISSSQSSLRHEAGLDLGPVALNHDFTLPFASKQVNAPAGQYFYAFCDRLPIRFRTSEITWNVAAGSFEFSQTATTDPADPAGPVLTRQFQQDELTALAPLLADPTSANRPSNDAFLENITSTTPITISTGTQGEALLTVQFDLGDGDMETHFPQGVAVSWTSGRFTLDQNIITGPNYLETDAPITVSYKRDCRGNDCGGVSGPGQMVFSPADDKLYITPDGGLRGDGAITPERLRWGTTELVGGGSPPEGGSPYAHQTSQWTAGALHAPGFCLPGTATMPVSDAQRPQSLLFSGVSADGSYERPLTAGYREGLADYAGLNLRVGSTGSKSGRSILAGVSTPDYDLNARSKYYLRAGGVTGIHEAQAFPGNHVMYEFDVVFDGLRLAFRDGENVESKTGGALHVKSPVASFPGFDLDFKELKFLCRGQPGKMNLATEGESKSLAYWGTDFTPLCMEFAQPTIVGGCRSVTTGFLRVGAQTRFPSITPQKLHATLGFKGANGNLITKADGLDVDSRFTLPPNIQVLGAGGVPWEVTITGSAYLNNPAPTTAVNHTQPGDGFLTFPASINVPWFEDMKVQFHVSASSTATTASILHVMGGWPSNPAHPNVHGWQDGSGKPYFTHQDFDPDHLAFPDGMTVAAYRAADTEQYNARAQKRWLGVVDFDLPLQWEPTQRRFTSSEPEIDELLVLGNVHRQVRSISPSTAELSFGLELDIPRVNTASLTAAVKEGISNQVADALTGALGLDLRNQIGQGITQLDGLLSERVNEVWKLPLNNAADPIASAVINGSSPASQLSSLQNNLVGLNLDDEIRTRIQSGRSAINGALEVVGTSGGRLNVGNMVKQLLQRSSISEVASLSESAIHSALAEVMPEIEPDLQQAQEALARANAVLEAAEAKVLTQVAAVFPQNETAIDNAASLALADIEALINRNEWQLLDENSKRDRIRRLISERVMASAAVPKFQYIVRQHVQDTNEVFRAALDDVFGQVNQLMRAVIKQAVTENVLGADVISPAVGQMGPASGGKGKLVGINIEGYAQINDESLRLLDLNGKFEFNVPDSLQVQAHLRIMEVDANTPKSGCRVAEGATASIVTVTARAQCDWISAPGTTLEVGAQFALIGGTPMGFDGYFAFSGEVSVGPVTVQEMRLMAGFGTNGDSVSPKVWAYIGGKARGLYGGYESAVGVFLGRTCDLDVLKMIDPFIELALTESRVNRMEPITGVYFYGEAWFPLNEVFGIPSTCMLTLKAGAGSGFFAFIGKREGTTEDAVFVGCKQLYGVEGVVLCALKARGTMSILGAVAVNIPPFEFPFIGKLPEDGVIGLAKSIATRLIGGSYVLRGEGEFELRFGYCPLCVDISRSIGLTWTISYPKASLGIDF